MKIQCDVCNKDQASVFCTADEAALCDGCDHRVHHANKLASKHQRFLLHHPSDKEGPVCDVCLERRAFVFCQQDRAILCRECDFSIHSANEHTQKHSRFLLTGIKLSTAATIYSSSASNSDLSHGSNFVSNSKSQPLVKTYAVSASGISNPPLMANNSPSTTTTASASTSIRKSEGILLTNEGAGSTSSISEYLIETLPGWQVEDLLDSSSAPFSFCKSDDMSPLFDADFEENLNSFSSKNVGIWVPQAPPPPPFAGQMGKQIGCKEAREATNTKANRSVLRDENFVVPQISPPSIGSKRSRFLW